MDIFDRYAPFVQEFIYRNNWQTLRGIQVAAGDAIFNTDQNVLLCASTASGKTEAAFFPILTLLAEDPPASVGAVYIGPLKALINDQFSRLNDLCTEAGIPVWHWHGDVAASHKAKMMRHPSGILQITPESLEAMLLHKHGDIARLFGDLRFVVIDEVHSLMRGDRGGQTLCLIERLSRLAGVDPRRIGLSATVGDPVGTGEYLASGTGRGTVIPRIETAGVKWRLSMEHFYISGVQAAEGYRPAADGEASELFALSLPEGTADDAAQKALSVRQSALPDPAADISTLPPEQTGVTDAAPAAADPGIGYIFEHTRGKKCLVFVNSREECEAVTTTLRQYCEAKHEPDRFLIHHGNLSTAYRETAEAVMKDEEQFQTTVTTATLELGIDIGRLERAFQIDAPFTVSSFLQRMGRTGRRGAPPEMWFVMREEQPEARALLPATIPWKLLQGVALVQLYREERWCEPPLLEKLPFSLLYHQTMSTLASCGEMSPAALAQRVLTLSPFRRISADDFRLLLRHLLETEQLQRTEEGGLIVGLAGERITNSFKFYAVFQENEEYTVRCDAQELGTVVKPPPVGEKVAIAGHVWLVQEVDHKRHLVYCEQVRGKVPAYFGECPGDIHTHILERMRRLLSEDDSYPYLMPNAAARLTQARLTARYSGAAQQPLLCLGGEEWCLLPWLGSYAFLALERFLKLKCAGQLGLKALDPSRPYFMTFKMKADPDTFFRVLASEAAKPFDAMELVYPGEIPIFNKYDDLLPPELVRRGFAYGVLDVDGMRLRIAEWAAAFL